MKKTNENETALPGMEGLVFPAGMRPAEMDMTDEKKFTAAVLFRDHPQVFKSVCVARFKHGLPVSWISELLHVSEHTVRKIEQFVIEAPETDEARAAFFVKSGVNKSRMMANRQAIDLLRKRMDDDPESLSVAEILSIVKATDTNESREERKDGQVIDAEFVDAFDDIVNGLEREKKSAANEKGENERENDGPGEGDGGKNAGNQDGECSTRDESLA